MPSYAKQWSYETCTPGVGLIHKALNYDHKIQKPNPPSALSHRSIDVVANPKTLIARLCGVATLIDHSSEDPNYLMATVGSRFSAHASKRLRVLAPSFVCFGASWLADCCTCSRQQMARSHRAGRGEAHVRERCNIPRREVLEGMGKADPLQTWGRALIAAQRLRERAWRDHHQ